MPRGTSGNGRSGIVILSVDSSPTSITSGCETGESVASATGVAVGSRVGSKDGCAIGSLVGSNVGRAEG